MDKTTISHLLIYIGTFISSYYVSLNYHSIISSLLFGWSIYGLTTIGHDLLHKPTSLNRFWAFFCLDAIIISSDEWIQMHNKEHHADLKGEKDIMLLKGNNLVEEWVYLLEISKNSSVINHIYRLPFYYLLFQLHWYQIIAVYFNVFFCLAYFTYITHGDSVPSIYPVGSIQHNLDNTWDIFPESWLCGLIFGSINIHATHHCFPTCSRSELLTKSKYLAKRYPRNYRSINTFQGLYNLYKNRK